jgi:hypothetical protein
MPALVGVLEVFYVHGDRDAFSNHNRKRGHAPEASGGAGALERHVLPDHSLFLPIVHQFLAYQFDVEPTPAGRTDSEEVLYFARRVSKCLCVI